jgi:hypothetical protein
MNPPASTATDPAVSVDSNGSPTSTPDGGDGGPATMGRRSFLRRVGAGTATAFVLADVALAYRAYDQGVLAEERGPAFDAWTGWRDGSDSMSLVGAAVLAASAHNTQPWRFAVSDGRVDLYADLERTTGANDALDREFDVSLGCALENLSLAARARGRRPEMETMPGGASELVASVRLPAGPAVEDELYRAIGDRHSNRSEYRSDPVPNSALTAMGALVDDSVAPARLMWLTSSGDRQQFGDLLVEATQAHVADDEQSRASFAWWRSDWDEIQRHKDGLTIDGVGLRPLVRTLGKLLPASSRASADRTFVDRTVIQARSAPAFGVIVVDDPTSRADRLAGGRLVQRLHLWSTAHDLGFQHMNQITERIDRDRRLGQPAVFEAPLADLVGDGTLVAFRVGTPTVASLRSPRRPVQEVLR